MSARFFGKKNKGHGKDGNGAFKYPGSRAALDGNTAVIMCERESSDAAGAYPITPSTQMGEYWAEAAASGHINISGRPLIFIEPEGEHAAAAVTAGMSMTGLRSANFSSGQGIAYMHESLYAAVGKRLTYVLNIGARAMTKATLNVHAGHDDYHCVDDTGFFQMFAKDAQSAADLNIISHRIAELSLTPGHHRPGRFPDDTPDRVDDGAGAGADRRVPGSTRRHHRDAHAGADDHLRRHAAAHPAALGRGQPGDVRPGRRTRTRTCRASPPSGRSSSITFRS